MMSCRPCRLPVRKQLRAAMRVEMSVARKEVPGRARRVQDLCTQALRRGESSCGHKAEAWREATPANLPSPVIILGSLTFPRRARAHPVGPLSPQGTL